MEQRALINSSQWDLNTVAEKVKAYNGLAVPAHIDAGVNSIISQLGFMPSEPKFKLVGITAMLDIKSWLTEHPDFEDKVFLRASDAHYLNDIGKGYSIINVAEATVQELILAAKGVSGRKIEI